ncbi:PsbP-related protein [Methanobacterium sp.]|uniref:PsbP-related protein n=1 Tax=Methanobacterium sp. TaxID=2164 RepID=UPI0025CEC282|nr:PsbP-related protein [Methanobacterium sp.]MBI5458968.1 hypothetical protein [Methanobacterium sp.]
MKKVTLFSIASLLLAVVVISGCTTQSTGNNTSSNKTFAQDGISFQYPGNWSEKAIPATDVNLTTQSGFKMLTILLEGNDMNDYTVYMGIGKSNMTAGNLTEAADRLFKYYITAEAGDYLNTTNVTLKNGYSGYEYIYGGTGASSGKVLDCKTYIFTKDNKTAYYIQFATPRGGFESHQNTFQNILNSVTIN